MKIDEAISLLKQYIDYNNPDIPDFYTMEEACEVVIKALEQQSCEDCIRRSDIGLTDFEIVMCNGDYKEGLKMLLDKIEKAPSVTPQPKMGQWIEHFDESGKWYECDQCHTDWGGSVNYCPNCGSKM